MRNEYCDFIIRLMRRLLFVVTLLNLFSMVGCGAYHYQYPGDLSQIAYGKQGYLATGNICSMSSKDTLHWNKSPGTLKEIKKLLYWRDRFVALTQHSISTSIDGNNWQVFSSEVDLHDLVVANDRIVAISSDKGLLVSDDCTHWDWIEMPVPIKSLELYKVRYIKNRLYLLGPSAIVLHDGDNFLPIVKFPIRKYPEIEAFYNGVLFTFCNPDEQDDSISTCHVQECDEVGSSNCHDMSQLPGGIHINYLVQLIGSMDHYILQGSMTDINGRFSELCYKTDDGSWALCNIPEKCPDGNTLNINSIAYLDGRFIAVGNQLTILTSVDGNIWTFVNFDPGKKVFVPHKNNWNIFPDWPM